MKDRWINAGFEEDELKPYTEPELDITDQKRIGKKMMENSLPLVLLVNSHNCIVLLSEESLLGHLSLHQAL